MKHISANIRNLFAIFFCLALLGCGSSNWSVPGSSVNSPPVVVITGPLDGSILDEGTVITFTGTAQDADEGALSGAFLVWTSDINGQIGTGTTFDITTLSRGVHVITLTATDASGESGTASITITIRIPWFGAQWGFRQQITISASMAPSDQTDFPAFVKITDQLNPLFDNAQADGDDILFTADDGVSKLDHEVEYYQSTGTEELDAWVRIANLSSTSDTVIYMYYGNSGALNQENVNGVWDAGFAGVWHLKEEQAGTGNLGLYRDSTANNNHGDDYVSATGQDGQINSGQEFDGVSDYVDFGNDASLDITGGITIEAWVKPALSGFDRARYVIDSVHASSDIDVVSYVDNNVISVDGSPYITLNAGQTGTIGSSDISQGSEIGGTGPFALASRSTIGDEMVPATFAGIEFVYDAGRSVQYLYFCNPFGPGNADITVYNSAGGILWGPEILAQGDCTSTGALNPGDDYYRVLSDIPILGQADNSTTIDGYVMYPIADDLWGIRSNGVYAGVAKDSTTVDMYASDGSSLTGNIYNQGDSFIVNIGSSGSDGVGSAIHLNASQSALGAIQQADSDGGESTTFLPNSELSYVFAVPQPSEYIALALNEGSKCVVYDSAGNILDQETTTQQTYPYPSKILFAGADYVQKFPAGVFVVCDAPAYAYYERIDTGLDTDEVNLWGLRDLGIVSKGGAYALTYSPGGKVNGFVNGIGISADVSLDVWSHLVLTYNGSEQKIYVDGVPIATRNLSGLILDVTTNLEIGRFANWYFNSSMDEVRVSDVDRSADWILTEYNNQSNPAGFLTFGAEEVL